MGARKLIEPVWADEQHDLGVDGLIDPWMEKFWTASAHLTTNPLRPPLPDVMPSPKFVFEEERICFVKCYLIVITLAHCEYLILNVYLRLCIRRQRF